MMITIDSRKLTDKETAHKYLKEVMQLPDYYGCNLDAFADVLSEGRWQLAIEHTKEAGPYYEMIRNVLQDVAQDNIHLQYKEYEGAARRTRLRNRFRKIL